MAKKLSVEEILAAARAEKNKGGGASPSPDAPSPAAEASAAEAAAAPAVEAAAAQVNEAPPAPATPSPSGKFTPGGKGMSMADILAAARAKPGAAPAAKSAAPKPASAAKPAAVESKADKPAVKPAAAKPAAKEAVAVAVAKDTASILAAARKGAKPGPMTKAEAATKSIAAPAAGKKKIEVPPMPAKPDYARAPVAVASDGTTRRSFFAAAAGVLFGSSLAIGFTSLAVVNLMWLLGLARFMFPNILIEPPTRFKVGFPDSLSPGQVETKFIPQFGVWIVKNEVDGQQMVYALKSVCTHLGCTPSWLEAEQKFKCPCHGSGFYKNGENFEGPAPRPLERYAISMAEDGQLLVDKSRTFQQELGQWKDSASFVPV